MWKGTKQCSYALRIVDYEGMISTLRPTTHGQWNEPGMDMLPHILSDMIQLDIKIFKSTVATPFQKFHPNPTVSCNMAHQTKPKNECIMLAFHSTRGSEHYDCHACKLFSSYCTVP